MIKTLDEAKAFRLDESTDAGEFLVQNLSHLPGGRPPRNFPYNQAMDVVCADEPMPEQLAAVMTVAQLERTLSGVGQWGISLECEADLDDAGKALAEKGIRSAEDFVRAAIFIRRGNDKLIDDMLDIPITSG